MLTMPSVVEDRRSKVALLLLLLVSSWPIDRTWAATSADATASVYVIGEQRGDSSGGSNVAGASASALVTSSPNSGEGSASALSSAIAEYGVLKAGVNAKGSGTGLVYSQATAVASFSDNFVIDAGPSYVGQVGTLALRISFEWINRGLTFEGASFVLDGTQSLRATSSLGYLLVDQRQVTHDSSFRDNDYSYRSVTSAFGEITETQDIDFTFSWEESIPFVFGSTNSIIATIGLSAFGSAFMQNAAYDIEIDALNSFYWGGMSVYDSNGNRVIASVVSDSGVDWSESFQSPIPEPNIGSLLLAGLFGLYAVRFMRRQR